MSKVAVLVVDDSVVMRQLIADALTADPQLDVVGTAANGKIALSLLDTLKPDVITLDLEMPEMDGLQTLSALRARRCTIPVIVFSTLSERGAKITLEALAKGAHDYVCKPTGQRNITATMERIRAELVPKIIVHDRKAKTGSAASLPPVALRPSVMPSQSPLPRPSTLPHPGTVPSATAVRSVASAMAAARVPSRLSSPPAADAALRPVPTGRGSAGVVVIGVSTGGPTALCEVIWGLPAALNAPVLVVQHMPPMFTKVLAQRLAEKCSMPVREAVHQERIEPGVVLIAPGDHHMRVAGSPRESWIVLDQSPQQNGCRPAVDPLFESASRIYGRAALGIVMTGLGHDGTAGARAIRQAGGAVWVQDEASCAAWSMPGSVLKAGLSTRVVRLHELAQEIGVAAGSSAVPLQPSVRPPPKRIA